MTLMLDIVVAVLLLVTIGFAIVLNRKLGSLRSHKEELEKLAVTFSQSTARAEDSIHRLKGTTEQLQKGIDKAQGLRDDLTFLIDRGGLTADRLEDGVRGGRGKAKKAGSDQFEDPLDPAETLSDVLAASRKEAREISNLVDETGESEDDLVRQKSQAEKDLIEALRQVR